MMSHGNNVSLYIAFAAIATLKVGPSQRIRRSRSLLSPSSPLAVEPKRITPDMKGLSLTILLTHFSANLSIKKIGQISIKISTLRSQIAIRLMDVMDLTHATLKRISS